MRPRRERLHLAYQALVNGYFTNVEVAAFLRCAVEGLPDPVIAIWDCGTMHKGPPIRELVEQAQGRLDIEPVPSQVSTFIVWPRLPTKTNNALVRGSDRMRSRTMPPSRS